MLLNDKQKCKGYFPNCWQASMAQESFQTKIKKVQYDHEEHKEHRTLQ
jgi:hypothetical protein